MRIIPRLSGAALAVALMLTGCVPTTTPPGPTPKPSGTPVFANEAEALAAATKAYAAYVKVSDEITADGGANPERIAPYVTAAQLKRDAEVFAKYSSKSITSVGATRSDRVRIQRYEDTGELAFELSVYLCLDLSGIRLINLQSEDITPAGLDRPSPMQVTFAFTDSQRNVIVVERSESWPGKDFCNSQS
jgi:hypothetical protein